MTSLGGSRSLPSFLLAISALLICSAQAEASGELFQKAGAAGCISSHVNDLACQQARELDRPSGMAISPDGKEAYAISAVSSDNSALTVFDRDPRTGELTQRKGADSCFSVSGIGCQNVGSGFLPEDLVVSPDGRNVYVTSGAGIIAFSRNSAGDLAEIGCVSWGQISLGKCSSARGLFEPIGIAITPDGDNVYVAAAGTDSVAVFDRLANGQLKQQAGAAGCIALNTLEGCAEGKALGFARYVAVSPDGSNVYVTSAISDAVAIFDRHADGGLEQKQGTAGCISADGSNGACQPGRHVTDVQGIAVSPDGKNVYAASSTTKAVAIFDRNAPGDLEQPPGSAGCISDAATPDGCQEATALNGPHRLVVSADGKNVYVVSMFSDAVTVLDRGTEGSLSQRPGPTGCISDISRQGSCGSGVGLKFPLALAISPDDNSVYVASVGSDAITVFDRGEVRSGEPPPRKEERGDTSPPVVSGFKMTPRRFRGRRQARARFRFNLSEPAVVKISIERIRFGRLIGKRCELSRHGLGGRRRCKRFSHTRNLVKASRPLGTNAIPLRRRYRGRLIRPGLYRARIVAVDSAGNRSQPRQTRFAKTATQ